MTTVHILNVIDKLDYNSGVCMTVFNYMRRLNPNRWTFDFATQSHVAEGLLLEEVTERGGKVFTIPRPRVPEISLYEDRWKELFRNQGYEVVYGHLPVTAFLYLHAAKKAGVPARVLHSHSTSGAGEAVKNFRNLAASRLARVYATHYAACSVDAGRYLFGGKIAGSKLTVIPNAIDCGRFRPDKARRENIRRILGVADGEIVVGHVGRFSPEKNQMFLLRAFAALLSRRPASLWVIGDGPLRGALEEEAARLGITERVRLLGVFRNIEEYLPGFDVFCLPSLFEGEPLSALEAQACGIPCVVSNRVTEKIGASGPMRRLSLDSPPDEWADALAKAAEDGDVQERAALFRESRYNIERSTVIMNNFLDSLLS